MIQRAVSCGEEHSNEAWDGESPDVTPLSLNTLSLSPQLT